MMAGATLKVRRYSGRFQGEMSPATPSGRLLDRFTTPGELWLVSTRLWKMIVESVSYHFLTLGIYS